MSFEEVVAPVRSVVKDCYWIVSGCVFKGEVEGVPFDESRFSALIIQHERQRRLLAPGFVMDISRYVDNTWCHIIGVQDPVDLATVDVTPDFLQARARVYFVCVDAAFWEVYSSDGQILTMLRQAFPWASEASIMERAYWG